MARTIVRSSFQSGPGRLEGAAGILVSLKWDKPFSTRVAPFFMIADGRLMLISVVSKCCGGRPRLSRFERRTPVSAFVSITCCPLSLCETGRGASYEDSESPPTVGTSGRTAWVEDCNCVLESLAPLSGLPADRLAARGSTRSRGSCG
jgi:hypothetical protein